jgi:hypothetical protein
MITSYYYNEQFKRSITQFSSIFAGLQVTTGKREDGEIHVMDVPVRYGSIDRVVAAVSNGFTQNKMMTLPVMSTYLLEVDLAPERRKGVGITERKTVLPQGGMYPNDLKVMERHMPIPYDFLFELAIYSSNMDQMFQILEQILIVFDPTLQIQTNDSPYDWSRQTNVELMSIAQEENYPMGTEKRMIVWTLNFRMEGWISPPMDLKENLVKKIIIRFGDLDGFALNEYDSTGELMPFAGDVWATNIIEGTPEVITNPTADPILARE